jgi:two-component system cell cycle sensor histidine kinase/response regulator CckA
MKINPSSSAHPGRPGLARMDRRLAFAFLGMTLFVVTVLGVGIGVLFYRNLQAERSRLSHVAAEMVAPGIETAKTAGEFRVQILAEQLVERDPAIIYVRVIDDEGVVAHAGAAVDPSTDLNRLREVAEAQGEVVDLELDGRHLTESAVQLRAGYDDAWRGVLRIGVSSDPVEAAAGRAVAFVLGLLALLISLVWPLSSYLGRRFAAPIIELEHSSRLAEEQRDRLAAAIESSDDGILIIDQGRWVYTNPALRELTGLDEERSLERDPVELLAGDDGARRQLETIAAGTPWRGRILARRGDGTRWHCEVVVLPIPRDEGPPLVVWNLRDVGREMLLEEQLRQSQKLDAIGQLAGGIAHDFNNMLTVVFATVDEIAFDETLSEDSRELLAVIAKAAEGAAELTKQILAFARRQTLELKPVAPDDVVRRAHDLLHRVIGATIDLRVEIPERPWMIEADEGQLEQVVMNLAINARDAMPEGGSLIISVDNRKLDARSSVDGSTLEPGEYVVISVRDTGTGISPELQARIFDPFFTTKAQGKGTGLGLSTVLGIVKQCGGYLWLDSTAGEGSVFSLAFPRREDVTSTNHEERSAQMPGQGETLLLVDDEPAVRDSIRRTLERAGYQVSTAEHGAEALARIREGLQIDLVLTDVNMPEMGGLALLRALGGSLPAVLMSGFAAQAGGLGDLGDVALVAKPVQGPELLRVIAKVLARSRRVASPEASRLD